jgi:hypothetical protein
MIIISDKATFLSKVQHLRQNKRKYKLITSKGGGLPFKKIGDDVIAQKPRTSFKQVVRHRMAFFKIKSACPSDFPKNHHITLL